MNLPDDAPVTEPAAALPAGPALAPTVVPATVHDPDPLHIAHEDHDHDPSNPHYFGLPLGVIIAALIATIAVAITLLKFFH